MKATVSAGFLFLGSILVLQFGVLPEGGSLYSLLLVLCACSGIVLICEMFASCCHEIVELCSKGQRLSDLKNFVTPPPADKIKEDSDDD